MILRKNIDNKVLDNIIETVFKEFSVCKMFLFLFIVLNYSVIYVSTNSLNSTKEKIMCPGLSLESRWGVHVDCILTTRGVQNFNCSSPVPPETVALYNCQRYFKQTNKASSPIKLMRCLNGKWTRMKYFLELKCEYECGKAQPLTKTLIINDRLTTRQIWPWHALIYLKLDSWDLQHLTDSDEMSLDTNSESQLIINELNTVYSFDANSTFTNIQAINNNSSESKNRFKRFSNDGSYYAYICGGSLISSDKILTAAHCLTNASGFAKDPKDLTVILGGISNSFYTNRQDSSSQIISVKKLYISSAFNYDKFEGDIGIISLANPAKLSNIILPVCLPENTADSRFFISSRKHGEVIGSKPEIGRTPLGGLGLGLSTQLKSKKLHVLPTIECSRNIDRFPSDKEYCAGMTDEVICSGDSGGGMISSPNFGLKRRYTIQGIVSYARARQLCENYAVFTRVYKFMDWIKRVMRNDGNETIN